MPISASQFPATNLPVINTNALAAKTQVSSLDNDPMVMNNSRYTLLENQFYGTSSAAGAGASSHHGYLVGVKTGQTPGLTAS